MAPRRNHQAGLDVHQLPSLDLDAIENYDSTISRCCVPTNCLRVDPTIRLTELHDVVKVLCNNDLCTVGQYMHRECFDDWEQDKLTYLKSCGRARSWSERQRHQNLWTKKGYDLAFKACGCLCGRGYLKKDLDWLPPRLIQNGLGSGGSAGSGGYGHCIEHVDETGHVVLTTPMGHPQGQQKKKKRRNKQNNRPTLAVSATYHPNNAAAAANAELRGRTGSLSSSNGSASPPATSSEHSASPTHSHGVKKKSSRIEFFSDRRNGSNSGNGIFWRRQDFSSFNSLPRHKLNSYHIKMEDEGNHGNDETRCFILSTLAAVHASRVVCVLCDSLMIVFDRYPLVDGTFFLSPRQHTKTCLEVKVEGRTQYLTAVCMGCLVGWGPGRRLRCRFCSSPWDGSTLLLGTMYSYDIFAAFHCCTDRSRCNNCMKPLLNSNQRLNFFSDYSHPVACPHCGVVDCHFVKPLIYCYTREAVPIPGWP